MIELYKKLIELSTHLEKLDETFQNVNNYSNNNDYKIYRDNFDRLNILINDKIKSDTIKAKKSDKGIKKEYSFIDEIYSESGRQMKIADIIEYILFSRGIYFLFQSDKFIDKRVPIFLEINLRIVNILMVYETVTVDKKLRTNLLNNLNSLIKNEIGLSELKNWDGNVGLPEKHILKSQDSPDLYFDSLLPKTAGGLWHEILVYCFILKYNLGYIFPLLLVQKPISLNHKLSPPDIILLHRTTYRYYGIEIGNLKERQSGGFMSPSGIPVIPIDTLNARISDRCPICGKWIGICEKVIEEFSNVLESIEFPSNEIRCLTDCSHFTLKEKLDGKCLYMKFRYSNNNWKFGFCDNKHYHYHCCLELYNELKVKIEEIKLYPDLESLNDLLQIPVKTNEQLKFIYELQKKLKSKFNFIKTHSIFYQELVSLFNINLNYPNNSKNINSDLINGDE